MQDRESSSRQTLEAGQNYFLKTLEAGLPVKPDDLWDEEWGQKFAITSGNTKHHDVDLIYHPSLFEASVFFPQINAEIL